MNPQTHKLLLDLDRPGEWEHPVTYSRGFNVTPQLS